MLNVSINEPKMYNITQNCRRIYLLYNIFSRIKVKRVVTCVLDTGSVSSRALVESISQSSAPATVWITHTPVDGQQTLAETLRLVFNADVFAARRGNTMKTQ